MSQIRQPAVAGMFYPGNPAKLRQMVEELLQDVPESTTPPPKAIIAPHAGYVYSGSVAASAYALLRTARQTIRRVVLLGPSHRVGFLGLATSSADTFRTPLGDIPIDTAAVAQINALPQVHLLDQAHQLEHSLEVHLPFLQESLESFTLVPVVVGDASAEEVAEVLELLWGGEETLIVVSSDLSHYHDYATAQQMDRQTSAAIEALRPEGIGHDGACGRNPVSGLLLLAREKGLHATTIDLRNSGDTAGPRDQVVGYGAYLFGD
ncbi:MAG: AmmeMemoRadiSam system protein B [Gammaproteobacteria bacterium]|nr:AmmeMemoRadiSam system protein B [Gammaproteobacteria bacterium]